MYGCSGSVTSTVRKPDASGGSSSKYTCNSFIRSRSKIRLPSEPLISKDSFALRPGIIGLVSKVPMAPFSKRARNAAASFTVTRSISLFAARTFAGTRLYKGLGGPDHLHYGTHQKMCQVYEV